MEKIVYAYCRCNYWQSSGYGKLEILFFPRAFAMEDHIFLGKFTIAAPEIESKKEKALVAGQALHEAVQNLLTLPGVAQAIVSQ